MLHLHNILSGIWAIESSFASNYLPLIASHLKGDITAVMASGSEVKENPNHINFAVYENGAYQISPLGEACSPEDAPQDSIAIIDISGAITKHTQSCGPVGMSTKAELLKRCYANDNIKSVCLRMFTGGGDGYAMFLMADTIAQKNKPVGVFLEDFVASAGYGIACGGDILCASSKISEIGSIGTFTTIVDYTEYYKNLGINIQQIYASKSTDKNQDFAEAIKGNIKPLQARIDVFNEGFLSLVKEGRGAKLTADEKVWGTGKMFFAEEALKIGLIDQIDTFENFIDHLNNL